MARITSSTLDELTKRVYPDWEIQNQINLEHPAINIMAGEASAELGGSGFFFPVRTETVGSVAFIAEDGDLPARRQSKVQQAVVSPVVFVGTIEHTGLAQAISMRNPMAYARAYDENISQCLAQMGSYLEGALFRDGSGLLCTFAENATASAGPFDMSTVEHLREGMFVDIIDASGTTRHKKDVKIVEVDWPNEQVTFDQEIGTAVDTGDRLFVADSQADTGSLVNREPIGVEGALLNSGTYLGIERDSTGNWQSSVLDASAFFDEDILLRARTRIRQENGSALGSFSSKFATACHPMQTDQLFTLAIPRIRYSGNESFDLGNSSNVEFGGMKFVTSHNCIPDKAYMGNWSKFCTLYTPNGKIHIDTEKGGSAQKWVATKDVALTYAVGYMAFACKSPVDFCRIHNLTERTR